MKSVFLLTVIVTLTLCSCKGGTNNQQATGQQDAAAVTTKVEGPYKVKSGYMENKMKGLGMIQKVWFDDYGTKQYIITLMGDKEDQYTSYSIIRDSYMYNFKNDTIAGTRMRTGISSTNMDYENMDIKDIERYGVKKAGKETLLGKECDIFDVEKYGMKVWIWKGIALKMIMKQSNVSITTETAVFREETVDSKLFELPENKEFKEM